MSDTPNDQRRLILIVGGIVSALLIAVLVVGIVLVNTLQSQAENDEYRACMARYGFEHDAPPQVGSSEAEQDRWIEAIAAAAERCSR